MVLQYKVFIVLFQVFLFAQFLYGSFERTAQPTSLFSRAMSGSAMFTTSNVWLNPASLAKNSLFTTSLFYSPSPFQLHQLSNYGLTAVNNFNGVSCAAGFSSFGFSLYKETTISFSAATYFTEYFAAGFSIHTNHLSIQSYGTAATVVFDVGAIFSVAENINIGTSFNNINRSTFGSDDDIPQTFITGFSYVPYEKLTISFDLVHDIRYSTGYRTGIEFSPLDVLILRAGTQGKESRLFGGIGISILSFQIDYGIATHTELGLTHSVGLIFSL